MRGYGGPTAAAASIAFQIFSPPKNIALLVTPPPWLTTQAIIMHYSMRSYDGSIAAVASIAFQLLGPPRDTLCSYCINAKFCYEPGIVNNLSHFSWVRPLYDMTNMVRLL